MTASPPARDGSPPDTDADGQPGKTLVPAAAGLGTTRDTERIVLDVLLDRPVRLSGVPTVVLWSRLAAPRGNARVAARLEDCASASRCTVLAEGQLEDGTWSAGSFVPHDIDLPMVDTTVPSGHRLRVTIVTEQRGTSGNLWVAVDSRPAPSRLLLPVV